MEFFDENGKHTHKIPSKRIVRHPDHHPEDFLNFFKNDLSLVQMESPITFSDAIKPIKMPKKSKNMYVGEIAVVCGYGIDGNVYKINYLGCC